MRGLSQFFIGYPPNLDRFQRVGVYLYQDLRVPTFGVNDCPWRNGVLVLGCFWPSKALVSGCF